MWPFMPGFFHLACFQSSSMSYHVSALHSFIKTNNIPLSIQIYQTLSAYRLMDIESLCGFQHNAVRNIYADVFGGYMFSTLLKFQKQNCCDKFLNRKNGFQSDYTMSHQQQMSLPFCPYICQYLLFSIFWIIDILQWEVVSCAFELHLLNE